MDFVTHLPMPSRHEYTAIMVIVDRFSKRIWTIPTWDIASAELTAELFMKHIIYENGICIEMVSDRDSKFTSKMWQDFHAALGITLSLSSSRHQSTDGQTERAIAHVEDTMRNEEETLCNLYTEYQSTPSTRVQIRSGTKFTPIQHTCLHAGEDTLDRVLRRTHGTGRCTHVHCSRTGRN
jgi:transposase InsO family protein